ncbi:MAG TPA: nucleoside phosphorylase [bacterium]|nr:nucleoside phosphorylase [bacterium]HPQ65343.1 nucleoside phosphorylase [bacterium]
MSERQYHIQVAPGEVGRYVILPGDPGRAEKIAAYFDDPREIAFNREYRTFTGTVDGITISVTSTGIGCPSTAIALEELIHVGADTFIRVGTAGSLQERVDLGDLAISTGAVRDEGTTRQYIPLEYPAVAHPEIVGALRRAAENLDYPHHLGITHCKDSFYSEEEGYSAQPEVNSQRWKTWMRGDVIATSMEEAALFVVGSLRRVRAGSVLAVIGRTWAGEPVIHGVGPEKAIETAIEAFRILERERR